MSNIIEITKKYSKKIDPLDLELLIAYVIKKSREFILAHPEYKIPADRSPQLEAWIKRRAKHEPIAYILGQKEFFGLNFKVNKNTLIPRPETELLVEEALNLLRSMLRNKLRNTTVIDVGTGSGNIIISLAKFLNEKNKFIALDVSGAALSIAKQNAKTHKVKEKIKFIEGNLLEPILKDANCKMPGTEFIILANLPYLSEKIYSSVSSDIQKYEPKPALLSGKNGLTHYEKLLKQIKKLSAVGCQLSVFMEISPEQKKLLSKIINAGLPNAKISFKKDLSGRWRLCRISLN